MLSRRWENTLAAVLNGIENCWDLRYVLLFTVGVNKYGKWFSSSCAFTRVCCYGVKTFRAGAPQT